MLFNHQAMIKLVKTYSLLKLFNHFISSSEVIVKLGVFDLRTEFAYFAVFQPYFLDLS